MKKIVVLISGLVLLFSGVGSAFASNTKLNVAIDEVMGTPYKYGGTTTEGFDCSGFILHIFDQFSTKLPRTSKDQSETGIKVTKSELIPGDLVFFNTNGKGISHAGIYIGDGKFAHSASSKGVSISKLSDTYYEKRYVTARRITTVENAEEMMEEAH
ncbi:hydrolase [Cohnella sp. CIP 111063]|uniref:C40 family peptidase n=1 Tax=unclassified Cohnella TaxID=2636738 RepID=UPI000B8BE6C1|nr:MULTISPECIES: C40 family peptidase [unclassified Cohnella]OXS54909.1 hydrolase [Cohnella sp. CIP 111063]